MSSSILISRDSLPSSSRVLAWVGLILAAVSVGTATASGELPPEPADTPVASSIEKPPIERRLADGSVAMKAENRPAAGIAAVIGPDGRAYLLCADPQHAALDKHLHERAADIAATQAWE